MAALTFADHEGFQKSVVRATTGGAAAGLVSFGAAALASAAGWVTAPGLATTPDLTMTTLTCAAVAAAACGSSWKARVAYGLAAAGITGAVALLFATHPFFAIGAAGVGLGALFAHSRQKESAGETGVGQTRMGRSSHLATAFLTALALVAGASVVGAFESRGLLESFLPEALAEMGKTGVLGFFAALGIAGAHVVREPDPVEQLYAKLHPELGGDLKVLAARAMTNYRRCAEALLNTEAGFARTQLSKSLSDVTLRILELARRWQGIDREMGERAEGEIGQRLAELRSLKETTKDEIARRQLGLAENALTNELAQIDRIRRGRERVVARLHGEMALLESTRFTLLSMKSSDAHLRAAELSALSESLSRIAREMDCEAEAVDEIISKGVDVGAPAPAQAEHERIKA